MRARDALLHGEEETARAEIRGLMELEKKRKKGTEAKKLLLEHGVSTGSDGRYPWRKVKHIYNPSLTPLYFDRTCTIVKGER